MPRPCAHSTRSPNSSSLTPLSATALILTLQPGRLRGIDAGQDLVELAPARDGAELVGVERVERDVDALDAVSRRARAAYFGSCEPLVVSVSSSSAPVARWRESEANSVMMPRRTSGSPPVSRSLRTPRSMKALHSRSSSSSVSRSAFGRNAMFSDMQ